MSYKAFVQNVNYSDLRLIHYHYAIQATLEISSSMVVDEDEDLNTFDNNRFAHFTDDINQEFDFDEEDIQKIEDLILNEYNEELTKLNELIQSKQKPKSWAYLVRFE